MAVLCWWQVVARNSAVQSSHFFSSRVLLLASNAYVFLASIYTTHKLRTIHMYYMHVSQS